MANNRIYMRCEGCGGEWFVAKHYSAGWWRAPEHESESLMAWLEKHEDCFEPFRGDFTHDGEGQFTLQYENTSEPWRPRPNPAPKGE